MQTGVETYRYRPFITSKHVESFFVDSASTVIKGLIFFQAYAFTQEFFAPNNTWLVEKRV